jgi:molybdate transport system ATP-binding protein
LPYLARLLDEAKVPMIYVSHQAVEIQRIASQVVRIENGQVFAIGGLELLDEERREVLS